MILGVCPKKRDGGLSRRLQSWGLLFVAHVPAKNFQGAPVSQYPYFSSRPGGLCICAR